VPPSEWRAATGPAGTVILADTAVLSTAGGGHATGID
jgi:hypothetical protein